MSPRLTMRSRVPRAALVVIGALAALSTAPAANADTVSLSLNYTCRFPLLRPQPLQLQISADLPLTIPTNTATGAFTIRATAAASEASATGLRGLGAASIEGTAVADATLTLQNGSTLPLGVPTTVAQQTLPATGGFTAAATGRTPSLKFVQPGTVTITVQDLLITLTPRLADGSTTGLATFEAECKQDAGQDNTLARILVTPPATPTPAPTPEPTAAPTPEPTPTTAHYDYGISGSATLKTLTKGAVPLSGAASADLTTATGAFSAALTLKDTSANLVALNFLPVKAQMSFVPQGPATGTLSSTTGLAANAKVRIKIPSVTLFGIQLAGGATCQARNPTVIALKSPGFTTAAGGNLTGAFAISDLTGCGGLTGIVSPLTAGSGNAIALKLTPKTAA